MTDVDRGQIAATAAEIYDSFFVPALFEQWTGPVLEAAAVASGDRILDVGCGTGVLTRAAATRVGADGAVIGVDPNRGMLAVAGRAEPAAELRVGTAEDLPFDSGSFDRVVSQFALMFFTDRLVGLREMARVTRPGGRIAVAVWAALEHNPGYAALTDLIGRLFGVAAADVLRAPFALGDTRSLCDLSTQVVPDPQIARHDGVARFASLESWLHTEIRGWTLADVIDDDGFNTLVSRAHDELGTFVHGGLVSFPVSALVASGDVPA